MPNVILYFPFEVGEFQAQSVLGYTCISKKLFLCEIFLAELLMTKNSLRVEELFMNKEKQLEFSGDTFD